MKNLAKQFSSIIALNFLAKLISFAFSVYLVRSLGPLEFGKIAFLTSLQAPLSRISTLGLDPIAVRESGKLNHEQAISLFQQVNLIRLKFSIALGVLWSVGCLVTFGFGNSDFAFLGILYTFSIVSTGINLFGAAQHFRELPKLSRREVIGACFSALFVVLIIRPGATAFQGAMVTLLVSFVTTGYTVWFGKELLGNILPKFNKSKSYQALINWKHGIWPLIISLSSYGYTLLEIPIVTFNYGIEEAGIYRAALAIPLTASLAVGIAGQVLYPHYVKIASSHLQLWRFCRKLNWLMLLALIVTASLSFLFGKILILTVYGSNYTSGWVVFALSMLAKVSILWVNVWSLPLLVIGGEKQIAKLTLIISVLTILMNFLAPYFGAGSWSVALLSLCAEISVGFVCLIIFRSKLKLKET